MIRRRGKVGGGKAAGIRQRERRERKIRFIRRQKGTKEGR